MNDDKNNEQAGCSCQGSNCCQPESPVKSGKKLWKTLVFTAIVLSACAVAAYSLFWNKPTAASPSCCSSGSASSAAGINYGTIIPGMDELLTGASFAFIIFPRLHEQLPTHMTAVIDSVKSELSGKDLGFRMLTVNPEDPVYIVAINNFNINEYPAILALGPNCKRVLTASDLSLESLLTIYRKSKAASSACCPPAGSGTK
jgi:hypothetical protein